MPFLPPSQYFPPAEFAEPDGLIGFGGELRPEWLLDAYSHGIFPWPLGDECSPIPWWSPDPRAIFEYDRFHVPTRLRGLCRNGRFEITFDQDFQGVMEGCATSCDRKGNTWITPEMIEAYTRLHRLGHAHSAEARLNGELVGGVYGVAVRGLFAAESMFYRVNDASKVALVRLIERLKECGYSLIDIQQITPNTARFGAVEIPRDEYLRRLASALKLRVRFS